MLIEGLTQNLIPTKCIKLLIQEDRERILINKTDPVMVSSIICGK